MPALEQQECYVNVPETVSPEAQKFLRTLVDPALMPAFPEPDNLPGWEKVRAVAEAEGKALSGPLPKRYGHTVAEVKLGCVPAPGYPSSGLERQWQGGLYPWRRPRDV